MDCCKEAELYITKVTEHEILNKVLGLTKAQTDYVNEQVVKTGQGLVMTASGDVVLSKCNKLSLNNVSFKVSKRTIIK